MKKLLCGIAAVLLMAVMLCGCGDRSAQKETVKKLETALNQNDINMILECYEPSVQSTYNGVMSIGSKLLGGADTKKLLQDLIGIAKDFGEKISDSEAPEIEIQINSLKKESDDKVLADLTFNYIFSEEMKQKLPSDAKTSEQKYAYLVCVDDVWYFSAEKPNVQE